MFFFKIRGTQQHLAETDLYSLGWYKTSCCHVSTQNPSTLNILRTKMQEGKKHKGLGSARSFCLPRPQSSHSRGMQRPGPRTKCGSSRSRSADGDCGPGWYGGICASKAHTALGSSRPLEMLSITLCLSPQLGCIYSVLKLIHQTQQGVVGRSRGRTWATSGLWQRVVQAPACRKPQPRTGV